MAESTQWEYRVVSAGSYWSRPKNEELEVILNKMGMEGWEAVSTLSQYGSNEVRVVFKRPLTEEDAWRRGGAGRAR